jgi:hypothetical protein
MHGSNRLGAENQLLKKKQVNQSKTHSVKRKCARWFTAIACEPIMPALFTRQEI